MELKNPNRINNIKICDIERFLLKNQICTGWGTLCYEVKMKYPTPKISNLHKYTQIKHNKLK